MGTKKPASVDEQELDNQPETDEEDEGLLQGSKAPSHGDLIPPDIARTMSYAFKFKGMLENALKNVLSEEGTDKKRAEFRTEIEKTLKELETPEQLKPSVDGQQLLLTSRKLSIGLDALSIAALSLQKDVDDFARLLKKEPAQSPTPQKDTTTEKKDPA